MKEEMKYLKEVEGELIIGEFGEEEQKLLAEELYQAEKNYNNGDINSKQRINTLEEIEEELKAILRYLKQQYDNCSNCGKELDDEEFINENNRVPYGDSYAEENITVGYECSRCGDKRRF